MADRRETSETASHQLAEGEDPLQHLRSKVSTKTAEQKKPYDLANEAIGRLKTAEAEVALQSALREATLEEMDARTAGMAEL